MIKNSIEFFGKQLIGFMLCGFFASTIFAADAKPKDAKKEAKMSLVEAKNFVNNFNNFISYADGKHQLFMKSVCGRFYLKKWVIFDAKAITAKKESENESLGLYFDKEENEKRFSEIASKTGVNVFQKLDEFVFMTIGSTTCQKTKTVDGIPQAFPYAFGANKNAFNKVEIDAMLDQAQQDNMPLFLTGSIGFAEPENYEKTGVDLLNLSSGEHKFKVIEGDRNEGSAIIANYISQEAQKRELKNVYLLLALGKQFTHLKPLAKWLKKELRDAEACKQRTYVVGIDNGGQSFSEKEIYYMPENGEWVPNYIDNRNLLIDYLGEGADTYDDVQSILADLKLPHEAGYVNPSLKRNLEQMVNGIGERVGHILDHRNAPAGAYAPISKELRTQVSNQRDVVAVLRMTGFVRNALQEAQKIIADSKLESKDDSKR